MLPTLTQFPEAGWAIYYSGLNPYGWHLLGVFAIACRACPLLGYTGCLVLVTLLWLMLVRGFKITFSRDLVVLHGRLGRCKLWRGGPAGDMTFRAAGG
ncbi:MAG: hypothetical protein ACIAXF_01490 [Phycisphaerales bacterium JB063]